MVDLRESDISEKLDGHLAAGEGMSPQWSLRFAKTRPRRESLVGNASSRHKSK